VLSRGDELYHLELRKVDALERIAAALERGYPEARRGGRQLVVEVPVVPSVIEHQRWAKRRSEERKKSVEVSTDTTEPEDKAREEKTRQQQKAPTPVEEEEEEEEEESNGGYRTDGADDEGEPVGGDEYEPEGSEKEVQRDQLDEDEMDVGS
jgi:hypothetical protein